MASRRKDQETFAIEERHVEALLILMVLLVLAWGAFHPHATEVYLLSIVK